MQYEPASAEFPPIHDLRENFGDYATPVWTDMQYVKSEVSEPCPICMEKPVLPIRTECNHIHCHNCLYHALRARGRQMFSCSLCRRTLPTLTAEQMRKREEERIDALPEPGQFWYPTSEAFRRREEARLEEER
jgi:hypothetical protein